MAVINLPNADPWFVNRYGARLLHERAIDLSEGNDSDVLVFTRALALDGLHFSLLDADQARRVARTLHAACRSISTDLAAEPSDDAYYQSLIAALDDLATTLEDQFELESLRDADPDTDSPPSAARKVSGA